MKQVGRRKVRLVAGDETLVSFGGGILSDEFIDRLGLPDLIDQRVLVKEREQGYRESETILALVASLITGGECLDDLFVLREESGFSSLWSHGEIPHPTTMWDFLRRFNLGHLRQIESVLAECFRRVYAAEPKRPCLTLDAPAWQG